MRKRSELFVVLCDTHAAVYACFVCARLVEQIEEESLYPENTLLPIYVYCTKCIHNRAGLCLCSQWMCVTCLQCSMPFAHGLGPLLVL